MGAMVQSDKLSAVDQDAWRAAILPLVAAEVGSLEARRKLLVKHHVIDFKVEGQVVDKLWRARLRVDSYHQLGAGGMASVVAACSTDCTRRIRNTTRMRGRSSLSGAT